MAAQVMFWGMAIYFCPKDWNSLWSCPGEWTKSQRRIIDIDAI